METAVKKVPEWEKGAITAEFATTLPAVMLVMSAIIAIAAAFGTYSQVSDAARAGARLAALGANHGEVSAAVSRIAASATLEIVPAGEWVTVRVQQTFGLGPSWLHPFNIGASATSWVEP